MAVASGRCHCDLQSIWALLLFLPSNSVGGVVPAAAVMVDALGGRRSFVCRCHCDLQLIRSFGLMPSVAGSEEEVSREKWPEVEISGVIINRDFPFRFDS